MALPSPQEILDASEEIERCLWRVSEARSKSKKEEWFEEADSEVSSILSGLSRVDRLTVMDQVVAHQEKEGLDQELIKELFSAAQISKEDLDAFRLAQQTPAAQAPRSSPRI